MSNTRLKVLTVATELGLGGGENRILNLSKSIDRERFDHTVATFYTRDRAMEARYGSLHSEFESAGVGVVDLDLPRPRMRMASRVLKLANTTSALLKAANKLRRYILEQGIQLVDAHMDGAVLVAVPAATAARVPVVLTLYHVHTIPPRPLLQPFRVANLRLADGIVTDSRPRAKEFARLLSRRRPAIYTVPNGVRLPPPTESRGDVLQYFSIPGDVDCVIGQVSGLVPFKGHRFLLDAAKLVLEGRKKTYILCVGFSRGADSHLAELKTQARDLGISDYVRFASYPDSIANVWNVIDIHVHASTSDSLPNAIIEGMSLAKPAVVTEVGGIPDVVEHERTGLLVRPGDSKALADSILRLLADGRFATGLGQAAQRKYLNHFTPECTTRSLERCMLEVLSNARSPELSSLRRRKP